MKDVGFMVVLAFWCSGYSIMSYSYYGILILEVCKDDLTVLLLTSTARLPVSDKPFTVAPEMWRPH